MSGAAEYRKELDALVSEDPRYARGAYDFVRSAVPATAEAMRRGGDLEGRRHISGRELLDGIRDIALEQFGPLTAAVLEDWGIRRTEDIGNIVFLLVGHGLLGASEEDTPADFAGGYSLADAFAKPFVCRDPSPADLEAIDDDRPPTDG